MLEPLQSEQVTAVFEEIRVCLKFPLCVKQAYAMLRRLMCRKHRRVY